MIATYFRSSSLGTLSICEQKFFLVYNLGLKDRSNKAALKGTIVHRVMQALADKKLAQQNKKRTVDFEGEKLKLSQCDNLDLLTQKSFDYYTSHESIELSEKDYNECLRWSNKAIEFNDGVLDPRNQNIYITEKFFDFEIQEDWAAYEFKVGDKIMSGRLGLKGTVDLILTEDENTLHVLDYKTGKRKNWATFKEKTYADLEYDTQLLLYYYALKSLYPDKEFWISIYYINDGGLFSFVYDEEHFKRAESMLKQKFEYVKSVEVPRLVSKDNTAPACQYMCAFSQLRENSNQSICHFFHDEIKKKGINNVVAEYANFEALGKYTGGGRIDQ